MITTTGVLVDHWRGWKKSCNVVQIFAGLEDRTLNNVIHGVYTRRETYILFQKHVSSRNIYRLLQK